MKKESIRQWCIWLDNIQKIASFHAVTEFEPQEFLDPMTFEHYAMALAGAGYRFQ